jgi:hypothetical protein
VIKRQADYSDAYEQRAQFHRPTDVEQIRAEVRRLIGDGLRVRDIADALRLNDADVLNLLAGHAP